MTKDEIQRLYEYDRWANNRVLQAASALSAEQFTRDLGGSFRAVRDTLVHIFRAEWIEKATGRPIQSERFSHRRCGAAEVGGIEKEQAEFVNSATSESLENCFLFAKHKSDGRT
jgi:uncharacterized damage-inducible protein DinB